MIELQWLIPLLPVLSALLVHLLAGRLGKRVARLSVGMGVITFLVALWQIVVFIASDEGPSWMGIGGNWGSVYLDPLSATMALVVAGFSLIVHIYSVRYMAEEPGYARFFMLLDLMTASILLFVTAGDLITLLIAWHLVSVMMYFLLGQNTESRPGERYAFWTFLTYRIGDLPMVLAAVILFQAYGALDFPTLFDRLMAAPETEVFGMPAAITAAGLIALSAFAKSAQFPLHTWLPYTMDGPTPVSALMHAGIVNAGGIIINRFAPAFVNADGVLHLLFVVGLLTAVIGSVLMLTQNDIKKSLGYSTMGQMGFMIMETGVGAFSLAVFHLIAHGMFKATMFLSSGDLIGDARRHDDVPQNPLYTFLVDRKIGKATRLPWLAIGLVTLIVPLVILLLAHWAVSPDFFQKQGAIVLLFFGWITGVQVLFATHRLDATNPVRMMLMILLSFALIVIGYSIIGHTFETFLYPDAAFREALYHAAGLDAITFDVLVILLGLIVLVGWIGSYLASRKEPLFGNRFTELRLTLYSLISRELYIADLYERLSQALLEGSKRINVWMRWR
ncbi:MAG: NADH-quinone oxidoreductase subunit L [Guyparkeria sp.]|uniref:NADH-quinone oxidoreductase subunit 5 family protein n=1 Tax=Guyparkeria sp. TaxID=2035736 RepID=UPI00397AD4CC